MKNERIAMHKTERKNRMAGTIESVHRITDGDKTGLAVYVYEWDKRDVINESLYAEPAIADLVKAAIPEEGPSVLVEFCPNGESFGDQSLFGEANEKATVAVFEYS